MTDFENWWIEHGVFIYPQSPKDYAKEAWEARGILCTQGAIMAAEYITKNSGISEHFSVAELTEIIERMVVEGNTK